MKSLRSRLITGYVLVLTLALAIRGFGLYGTVREFLWTNLDQVLADKARLAALYLRNHTAGELVNAQTELQLLVPGLGLEILDAAGARLLVFPDNPPEEVGDEPPAEALLIAPRLATVKGSAGTSYRTALISVKADEEGAVRGWVRTWMSVEATNTRLRRSRVYLILSGLVAVCVTIAVGRFLLGQWFGAVRSATNTARRLSAQNISKERLYVPPDDLELAELTSAFNALLDRLGEAYALQQQFVADASHELRTPLTILRGEIEVTLRRERTAAEYQETLGSCREEIERLARLVDNMLMLARADAGQSAFEREILDLAALAERVVDGFKDRASEAKIALTFTKDGDTRVRGERLGLERIVANLVENAIRYSPAGESVTVRVLRSDADVILEVADTGVGIDHADLPRIFDRFYRVDKTRSQAAGGAGLGLSIVKTLAELHGARVEVESTLGRGSTFCVRFPAAR